MQDGADPDDMHGAVGRPDLQGGLLDPAFQLVTLFGRANRLVVLDVVEEHGVGAVWAVPAAAQLLAGAEALDADILTGDDLGLAPDAALAAGIGKIALQARVGRQLGLDRLDQQCGLGIDVADLERVAGLAHDDAVKREAK